MEIQSQQLVKQVTTTETQLSEANAKADNLETELAKLQAKLEAKLEEKAQPVGRQSAPIATSRQAQRADKGGEQFWQRHDQGYRWSRRPGVRRFIENSSDRVNPRQAVVEAEMTNDVSLENMIRRGVIKSVYDCLPEHRVECFDVIKNVKAENGEETVIEEWGVSWNTIDNAGKREIVSTLFSEAASRGFNLLTNEELETVTSITP